MARKTKSPIEQIRQHLKSKQNFVLSGGAGSGKTRTLIESLDLIYEISPKSQIACITFTNVAADEIKERVREKKFNLRASTIHDFLWDCVKNYQKNLKQVLLELIAEDKIKYEGEENLNLEWFYDKSIHYREWRRIEEGVISHDEVLVLANRIFEKFPLIRKIVSDKFNYIFIDEYQDTEEQVVEIFLDFLQDQKSPTTIGLFGDSMQSIYEKRVGDLNSFISNGTVKEVYKEDNWRCSKSVIKLINIIRNDSLIQQPGKDNPEGKAIFLYSQADSIDFKDIKNHEVFQGFDFSDPTENKELYLTHKLIANQLGYGDLLSNYKYRDNITGDKPDDLIEHLLTIQEIIYLYESKQYNSFIKKTDFRINKLSDKKILKEKVTNLKSSREKSIHEVIDLADKLGLVKKNDKIQNFVIQNYEQYDKVKNLRFMEIVHLFDYRNELSPYSTQHGVKGAEFNNVFVVLDNGRWNQYNFKSFFENTGNPNVIERTRKIFYVCCSRAKKDLVIFYHKPTSSVIGKAVEWFGSSNVIQI